MKSSILVALLFSLRMELGTSFSVSSNDSRGAAKTSNNNVAGNEEKSSLSASSSPSSSSSSSISSLSWSRRTFMVTTGVSSLAAWFGIPSNPNPAHAVRAVGGGELECQVAGNCWQVGEWDGAIGWTWGAKDRCDAMTDPTCGSGGNVLQVDENGNLRGKPVPFTTTDNNTNNKNTVDRISHVVVMQIDIGREESGVLKLGLYGKEAPILVQQMLDFLGETGLETLSSRSSANFLAELAAPVALGRGGSATWVTPGTSIEFGVPSQALAYAKSRGGSAKKVLDSFVAQPRPSAKAVLAQANIAGEAGATAHSVAGLLSVPKQGLGYGGTGLESDDTAYERAFLITNNAAPALDKTRRVIGQVLDGPSMAFLERLANLPTKRGIRGVIPGQDDGPPLQKVTVRQVAVATIVNSPLEK